jgi:ESX-1 secreted protein B PE domain
MGGGVRVIPDSLDTLAELRSEAEWPPVDTQVQKLDSLPNTQAAVDNLNANAETLAGYQTMADQQNQKLNEMLRITAGEYRKVDEKYADKINSEERAGAVDAIAIPEPGTQVSAVPDLAPFTPVSAGGYSDVEQTQQALLDGDHGASLQAAAAQWTAAAAAARRNDTGGFPTNWEGDAADAAMTQLNDYAVWLGELAAAWDKLATAAELVLAAHIATMANHSVVYSQYMILKAQLAELAAHPSGQGVAMAEVQRQLMQLQERSDDLREDYAGQSNFTPAKVPDPGYAKQAGKGTGPGNPGTQGVSGGGSGSGSPAGGAPEAGQPAVSPQSADPAAGQSQGSPSGAGSPSSGKGSSSGGGSPSSGGGSPSTGGKPGGGLPGGGLPGGGMPETGLPELGLDDPGVSPAAAGGDGSGRGSGGGAGGGKPSIPLQPNVGPETVAPGPGGGARGGGSGAIPASAMGGGMGGMGGGMGGMGHGGGQQGKEKRRDARFSPDEDVYVEDRPYTEPVIGNRRRKDVQDKEPK